MTFLSSSEFVTALPEITLAIGCLVLLLHAAFVRTQATVQATVLAVMALSMALLINFALPTDTKVIFNGLFVYDSFGHFAKALVLGGGILCMFMVAQQFERYNIARPETPTLMLFSILGMLLMISAHDLMSVFLGLELQSFSIYILAAINRDDPRSNEAAIKYFVLGALSSAIILYGFTLVYGYSGTTNFDGLGDVIRAIETPPVQLQFGLMLILCGIAFKISAVPFHMWTPDVYEGVPTPITAFFAVLPKAAGIALLARFIMGPLEGIVFILQKPLILLAIASIFVGSIAAIFQQNIKRLMAYSSISHVGFILLGLVPNNDVGLRGMLLYIGVYMLMGIGFFSCLMCLKREGRPIESLSDFSGLAQIHPYLSIIISGLMLSLAGIPPLAGFFGKFFVIMGLVNSGFTAVAVLAILGSAIGVFYYLRVIKIMYFDALPAGRSEKSLQAISVPATRAALFVAIVAIGVISLFPRLFYDYTLSPATILLMR